MKTHLGRSDQIQYRGQWHTIKSVQYGSVTFDTGTVPISVVRKLLEDKAVAVFRGDQRLGCAEVSI